MVYYSSIRKNKILPFAATWMDLENSTLSEVNQKEKENDHIVSLIGQTTNMIQMNLFGKQKQTHLQKTN